MVKNLVDTLCFSYYFLFCLVYLVSFCANGDFIMAYIASCGVLTYITLCGLHLYLVALSYSFDSSTFGCECACFALLRFISYRGCFFWLLTFGCLFCVFSVYFSFCTLFFVLLANHVIAYNGFCS